MRRSLQLLLALVVLFGFMVQKTEIIGQAQALSFEAEVNKIFNPINIKPGELSRLSISIYNSNEFQLDNAAWMDDLVSIQPGLRLADNPNITTDCGGLVAAEPGNTSISLTGGTVPAQVLGMPGACTVSVDVTSTTPGNLINTIYAGDMTATGGGGDVTNTSDASATLLVDTVVAPTLTKSFAKNTIWVGESVQLTLQIKNNDTEAVLTQTTLTDTFPSNIVVANPVNPSLTNCGSGTLTAISGAGSITLNNASIATGVTCIIRVNVTSSTAGIYNNQIDAGAISTRQGVTNASPAAAPLNVQSVGIQKAFSPTSIQAGEISKLTITLRNPTGSPFTHVQLSDVLPTSPNSNLRVVDGTAATTCTSGGIGTASTTLPGTVTLTDGTVPAGTITVPGTCTISVDVTTPDIATSAPYTNNIPPGAMTADGGITNVLQEERSISVQALSVGVNKGFSPISIQQGRSSQLTITLSNPTSSNFTSVAFTDNMPAGLVPLDASTTCGGTASFDTTSTPMTVSLSGGTVPARTGAVPGTCTVITNVTAASTGTYTNTIPANTVFTFEGITNLSSSSRSITVYTTDRGITASKSFSPSSIGAGTNSQLHIQITAPSDEDLTGFQINDTLPGSNLLISNPSGASNNGCGAGVSLTANPNTSLISLTGGTITKGTTCHIYVNVTSNASGTYTNSIPTTDFINNEGQKPPADISSTLIISHLTISKAFYPATVAPNGHSRLTITLTNTNTAPLASVSLLDNLNTMGGTNVTVSATPNAFSTCGAGSFTYPNSQTVSLTNGTIPAQVSGIPGVCTVSFDVRATGSATTRTNTLSRTNVQGTISGVGTVIKPVADATAQLKIANLILNVVQGFSPLTVFGGSTSTLSVQLVNPNATVLTNISLTDTMPAGMIIANPPDLSTGTCGGTLTGNPGSNVFTFSGGVLNAGKRCTLTLSVTMNVNGNRTNTLPTAAVTTFNGASNTQPAQASLTNLPGASISKYFSPNPIVVGDYSLLTITITNTGNIALSGMGMTDTLPGTLPAGLSVAGEPAPAPTNSCGGSLKADPGTQSIVLTGGSLPAGPNTTCSIVIPVTSAIPGNYENNIEKNNLVTTEGATNTQPAIDTLVVTSSPELQITKDVTSFGPYLPGDSIIYSIVATNKGDIPLSGVTITDAGTGAVLGSCTPDAPASLAPGETLTCSASHLVTPEDGIAGVYSNTAVADSNETDPVSDSVEVPIEPSAAMSIKKISTASAPHMIGQTLTYEIRVTNIGADNLTGVTVTDPGAGVVMGSCEPLNGSSLSSGETMTCNASHIVTQSNVDAGVFSNTATATSNETPPVSDTVEVPITQSPELKVFKQVTSIGPYAIGSQITFDISAINTGNQTLTGVSITDPGVGVTLGSCTPSQPATLLKGEIISCSATHIVVQQDLDSGGYSNTAYADSAETEPVSDTATVITKVPTIRLDKVGTVIQDVVPPNNMTNVGDRIQYAFTITNTGEVILSNVQLIDIAGGVSINGTPIPIMAPGAVDSTTYSASYTLTQADVDAGTFTNIASVTGTPPIGSNVSDTDSETKILTAAPSIDLIKTGTLHQDNVAPTDQVNPGDSITYAFTVTNTGNVTLNNISITDPSISVAGDPIASLAPGESNSTTFSGIYTLTQSNVDAGTFTNTATVTAATPALTTVTDTDDDTQTLPPDPSITIVKTGTLHLDIVAPDTQADSGDTISYAFTVTNTGNVTLSNVRVTDPFVTISGGPITLAPGASDNTTFTDTYTLIQSNIDAGAFTNTATGTGRTPGGVNVSDTDDDTQLFVPFPSIDLQKTGTLNPGGNGRVDAGDTISYSFTVKNTGNVTLSNITLVDAIGGITITGGPIPNLSPGSSNNSTFTGTYTLTQTDIDSGSFNNTASATGTPPSGPDVTDTDDDVRTLTQVPSIQIIKTGTLHTDVIPPDNMANPGDSITYTLDVTNTGNVTLTNVIVTDLAGGVTINGSPIASLAPAETSTVYTGSYTLTQSDVDSGTYSNTAQVNGTPPTGPDVTDTDTDTQTLTAAPIIGVSKRVVGSPQLVSAGTWDVTFEILVRNYGNVTLNNIQVTDDLDSTFSGPTTFAIQSLASSDFAVNWPGYDGSTNQNLLTGTDYLTFEGEGKLTLVVRVIPADSGPFLNTAIASGTPPVGDAVTDDSQDGIDPDPDPKDGNPTNNNDPTPVDFGPNMFDPPFGIKLLDKLMQPSLEWTIIWINDSNIVAVNATSSDPIPVGTVFEDDGIASGYPLPQGVLPDGTVASGVSCEDSSNITSTQYCYYEGPTIEYPLGRIVWKGILGPDLGVTDSEIAVNDIHISFHVLVDRGVRNVLNVATIDSDLNGDGDPTDPSELEVASASATYRHPKDLPKTGFTPGIQTVLPDQSADLAYSEMNDMWLEIPALGIKPSIVGVPLNDSGEWDVSWLGSQVGWLNSTAFPTWNGNSVLTAHVTDTNGKPGLFADLGRIQWGNKIIIHSWGQAYTYEVRSINPWASSDSIEVVTKHEELPWLTLITCHGYNENLNSYTWRIVVRAVLVNVTDDK